MAGDWAGARRAARGLDPAEELDAELLLLRLRAELGPGGRRGGYAVALALEALQPELPDVELAGLQALRPVDGWDEALAGLRNGLALTRDEPEAWLRVKNRLLMRLPRDAVSLDALRRAAEGGAEGPVRVLVDALAASGDAAGAVAAARDGARVQRRADARLRLLDRALALAPGDVELRAAALALDPHPARALGLAAAAGGPELAEALLERVYADPDAGLAQLALELLAGQLELVAARLDAAARLDWALPGHPGPLGFGLLLGLGLGGGATPDSAELAQVLTLSPAAPADPPLRLDRALAPWIARAPSLRAEAGWARAVAWPLALAQLDLAAAARSAYGPAAARVRAWAAVEAAAGDPEAAARLLEGAAARHPRHRALARLLRFGAPPDGVTPVRGEPQ